MALVTLRHKTTGHETRVDAEAVPYFPGYAPVVALESSSSDEDESASSAAESSDFSIPSWPGFGSERNQPE